MSFSKELSFPSIYKGALTLQILDMRTYVVRKEVVPQDVYGESPPVYGMEMWVAYTRQGLYIGDTQTAANICGKRGIVPEYRKKSSRVCSIGFCEKDQKWYGWSHRGICGFGIGDKVFEEGFGDEKTPFIRHGKRTIHTLDDAKLAAKRFAKYMS